MTTLMTVFSRTMMEKAGTNSLIQASLQPLYRSSIRHYYCQTLSKSVKVMPSAFLMWLQQEIWSLVGKQSLSTIYFEVYPS